MIVHPAEVAATYQHTRDCFSFHQYKHTHAHTPFVILEKHCWLWFSTLRTDSKYLFIAYSYWTELCNTFGTVMDLNEQTNNKQTTHAHTQRWCYIACSCYKAPCLHWIQQQYTHILIRPFPSDSDFHQHSSVPKQVGIPTTSRWVLLTFNTAQSQQESTVEPTLLGFQCPSPADISTGCGNQLRYCFSNPAWHLGWYLVGPEWTRPCDGGTNITGMPLVSPVQLWRGWGWVPRIEVSFCDI